MYDHHLEDMIRLLAEDGMLKKKDKEAALTLLRTYWEDQIAVVWGVSDVLAQAKAEGIRLTRSKARDVLSEVFHRHDATIGINWNVISTCLPAKRANRCRKRRRGTG